MLQAGRLSVVVKDIAIRATGLRFDSHSDEIGHPCR